jgi:hypothetical protein
MPALTPASGILPTHQLQASTLAAHLDLPPRRGLQVDGRHLWRPVSAPGFCDDV